MIISREIIEELIVVNGAEFQFDKAIEEMAELIKAIMDLKLNNGKRPTQVDRVLGEVADVSIMMEVLAVMLGEGQTQRHIYQKLSKAEGYLEVKKNKDTDG